MLHCVFPRNSLIRSAERELAVSLGLFIPLVSPGGQATLTQQEAILLLFSKGKKLGCILEFELVHYGTFDLSGLVQPYRVCVGWGSRN